ncbi:TIGR04222 domain-containing membrane protein, partial [bacterium]
MKNSLWERLQQFDLDAGAQFSFSRRLARDNAWSHEYALRVCEEYKKFLYLACTAGHMVSPSEEVDQAWHLHLTYTRSYWEELCPKVLGQPLHHEPTRGGKVEGAKFENLYERTLASYREAFETEPPPDIWPTATVRFGDGPHFRRVNVKRNYVIPKPNLKIIPLRMAPMLLFVAILAGCSATRSFDAADATGNEFLIFFWSLCAIAGAGYFWIRSSLTVPDDADFPAQKLDPYLLARLANPGTLPIDAALCNLKKKGLIEVNLNGSIRQVEGIGPPSHPFERRVWDSIGPRIWLEGARIASAGAAQALDRPLVEAGLLLSAKQKWSLYLLAAVMIAPLFMVALARVVSGGSQGSTGGYLVFSCLLLVLLGVAALTVFKPWRTRRGERYLASLRRTVSASAPYDPADLTNAFIVNAALWGSSELIKEGFDEFYRRPTNTAAYVGGAMYSPVADGGSASGGDSSGSGFWTSNDNGYGSHHGHGHSHGHDGHHGHSHGDSGHGGSDGGHGH